MKELLLSILKRYEIEIPALLAVAAFYILELINPSLAGVVKASTLLFLLRLSFSANIGLLAWVILLYIKNRYKCRYGILWDRHKQPHCPICKTPLCDYGDRRKYYGDPILYSFCCLKCEKNIALKDDEGISISLKEAQKRL